MKIFLWYSEDIKQWRWTLTEELNFLIKQESGSQPLLRDAMNDVANTVEYLIREK